MALTVPPAREGYIALAARLTATARSAALNTKDMAS
jgi:hypothetical protein